MNENAGSDGAVLGRIRIVPASVPCAFALPKRRYHGCRCRHVVVQTWHGVPQCSLHEGRVTYRASAILILLVTSPQTKSRFGVTGREKGGRCHVDQDRQHGRHLDEVPAPGRSRPVLDAGPPARHDDRHSRQAPCLPVPSLAPVADLSRLCPVSVRSLSSLEAATVSYLF